jgi:antitoxin ParD1/3/4
MTKIDKISVTITREQHAKIKAAVERGDYATTSEVIRTALREWELKEELRRIEGESIGKLWDEGIASGPSVEGPPAMEHLRAKYAAIQKKSGKKRAKKAARPIVSRHRPGRSLRRLAITLPRTVQPMRSDSSSG